MRWNYLSIPKLQRCNHWSLGMDLIPHCIMDVITYPCRDQIQSMLVKGATVGIVPTKIGYHIYHTICFNAFAQSQPWFNLVKCPGYIGHCSWNNYTLWTYIYIVMHIVHQRNQNIQMTLSFRYGYCTFTPGPSMMSHEISLWFHI